MTAPNSVETFFSPAGSAAGSLPASRSSRLRGGDSGGASATVAGRDGAAVSEATAVDGRYDSPAAGGREDDSTAVDGRDDDSAAVDGRDASRSVSDASVVVKSVSAVPGRSPSSFCN